eukprot:CAMPEP_0119545632 /NCGR_PEP_ID=MMETSP1352-20130426/326_1 /TAXON_ID=265584 /ORGANISM="Stauroneis constricta, Strain CCMP1120" /LENGTH=508 /DNA_ID=CAMNT_0007590205 /DNA_START=14 /DNA_END=1540 /DNA_ORIENTATION=+
MESSITVDAAQRSGVDDDLEEPLLVRHGRHGDNDNVNSSNDDAPLRHRLHQSHSTASTARILDRDAGFRQSRGRWSVERLTRGHRRDVNCCRRWHQKIWKECIKGDWFHRLAYMRTIPLLLVFLLAYCTIITFFAFVYLAVSQLGRQIDTNADGTSNIIPFCNMDISDHLEALYFSLSTMTTIGYGVSNYYYSGCWTPLLLVLWQVCTAILFDAIAVGLIFHRISRGRKRGKTITFSDKAVIRKVRGVPYLMFRLGELRKYSLIEANLRVYCVRHERHAVPKRSSHAHALLQEQQRQNSDGSNLPTVDQDNSHHQHQQHQQESQKVGNSDSPPLPPPSMEDIEIETTHFITRQVRLLNPDEAYGNHILMSLPQVVVHRLDRFSPLMPPQPVWYDRDGRAYPGAADFDNLQSFLHDRLAEIVVLVEGTDEGTGAAVQARHSYTADDLEWNKTFAPCIAPRGGSGNDGNDATANNRRTRNVVTVDFSKFHHLMDAPLDCETCPYIPNDVA